MKTPPYIIYNSRIASLVTKLVMPISAITIWPFIMIDGPQMNKVTLCHETIHIKQWTECLLLGFLLIYVWDYLWSRLVLRKNHEDAYMSIRFEREAYSNQNNLDYPQLRKHYSWLPYGRVS